MANKAPKPKDNFTRNLVIAVVVGILAIMVIPKVISSQKSNVTAAIPSSGSKADGYGVVFNGGLSGVPTVDVWEDFQCPVCQQFESLNGNYIESLITEKKAKVIFHPLSFIGQESVIAANAAACSDDEGKYVAFHKALYNNQSATENSGKWTADYMVMLGESLGITSSKFASCVKNGDYAGWVTNVAQDGATKNINSTPTIFVNGKEINRNTDYFNAEAFKKVIGAK